MKAERYDYSALKLSTLTQPRYRHIAFFAADWALYFAAYMLTERLIPAGRAAPMHCFLDDLIPFCEYWAVFYVFWYALVGGTLLYYAFYDVRSFSRQQLFIAVTQLIAIACYIAFPSRQDLRPQFFERDNLFTRIMGLIYGFDTNTGVCPSLHVAYSCGIASVFYKKKELPLALRLGMALMCALICLSTAFVKQHSMVDVFCGALTAAAAELIVYKTGLYRAIWPHEEPKTDAPK